jgi:O-antigen/teichoic acid export membrane protein
MNKGFFSFLNGQHIKKFVGFSLGSIGALFFSFLATFFLNKALDKVDMGAYSYVFNLLNLAYPLTSLSLSSGYIRFIGVNSDASLIRFVTKLSFFSTFFFGVLIWGWFSNWLYLPFAFIILYQERLILARAQLDIFKYNFLNISQKIVFLALLVFLFYIKNGLTAGMVLFLLGITYLLSYFSSFLLKKTSSLADIVSQEEFKKTVFLKFCIITMFTVIVQWMLTVSDQIIIEHYYGYEMLAPYSVAYRIVTILSLVSGIFLSYYPSVYFKEIAVRNVTEVFSLRKYFMLVMIFSTALVLLCKNTIYMIFGADNYIEESDYFLPLLLGEMCRIMASVLMTFLTFKLKQTSILITMLLIAMLNIALNIALVPYYGPIASAYCTLICFILYLAASFWVSYIPERRYIMSDALN